MLVINFATVASMAHIKAQWNHQELYFFCALYSSSFNLLVFPNLRNLPKLSTLNFNMNQSCTCFSKEEVSFFSSFLFEEVILYLTVKSNYSIEGWTLCGKNYSSSKTLFGQDQHGVVTFLILILTFLNL